LGVRLHRPVLPFLALLLLFKFGIVFSLLPHLGEEDPTLWTIQAVYLIVTGIFFAMLFADGTRARMEIALGAHLASCLFAATLGLIGYFGLSGSDELFVRFGRASGTFKDPNVFGSFLLLGAFYLIHNLLTGATRRPLLSLASLSLLLAGIFLSFSRGSWGAFVVGSTLLVFMTFATAPPGLRRRIATLSVLTGLVGAVLLGGLVAVSDVGETFSKRAQVTQDYDEGETGRFGNQIRSLPMLLETPEGFGPIRYRLRFHLDPHNSYVGSFANGGWLSGFAFIGLVLATGFVGFRLCFQPSPYQRLAQIVWPALLMFFLQAMQIDVEKWRHVYMMMGMVWGLEAARMHWLAREHARSALPAASAVVGVGRGS
jgi:hypothetical protein